MAAMAMVMAVAVFGTSYAAFGAGGYNEWNTIGGSFNTGSNMPWYSSWSSSSGGTNTGSFQIHLEPSLYSFTSANWNFTIDSDYPKYWYASAFVHGQRYSQEPMGQNLSWNQNQPFNNGANISANLSFSIWESLWSDGVHQGMDIYGSLSVTPSRDTSSNFRYWEGYESVYHYDEKDAYQIYWIETIPVWYAEYSFSGYFDPVAADSSSLTGSMPEPATLGLLGLGGLMAICRRRRT